MKEDGKQDGAVEGFVGSVFAILLVGVALWYFGPQLLSSLEKMGPTSTTVTVSHEGPVSPSIPSRLTAIEFRTLRNDEFEEPSYNLYVYLISLNASERQKLAAVCAFLGADHRPASGIGGSIKRPESTALYYLPFQSGQDENMRSALALVPHANARQKYASDFARFYDEGLARRILQRTTTSVGGTLADGLYILAYVGGPLPDSTSRDDPAFDYAEMGRLTPTQIYHYVTEYRKQIWAGGEGWKDPTTRQIGLRLAEQLGIVAEASKNLVALKAPLKEIAGEFWPISTAEASAAGAPSTQPPNPALNLLDPEIAKACGLP